MKHIVAATDGSTAADAAVDRACELAKAYRVPLTVVHVVPTAKGPAGAVVLRPARALGEEILSRVMHRCELAGVRANTIIEEGPAAEAILRVAKERGADLVVCGSHGRGRVLRAFLGSTSTELLHANPGAVLVVPPHVQALDVSADRL